MNPRRLVVEEGGLPHDSDAWNGELPHHLDVDGKPHLVVPDRQAPNDTKFTDGLFASSEDFVACHRDAFDTLCG